MTELNNKTFGEKFLVKINKDVCPHIHAKMLNNWRLLDSTQAAEALNYLEPFIRRGIMPEKNETNNMNLLGLYSYIADREYFEEEFFQGFISLKEYHHLFLYEKYYNPEDRMTLYVYLDEFNMKTDAHLYKVKTNKAYSFYMS